MLKNVLFRIFLVVSSLGFVLFRCQLPQPPASPDQVRIDVVLRTSDGKTTGIEITDTIGNQPQLRVIFTLTHYIDSAKIVILSDSMIEQTIPCRYKMASVDTVFFPIIFTTTGTRTVKVTGYIDGYPDIVSTVTVHIAGRQSINLNHHPQWDSSKVQRSVMSGVPFSYSLGEICSDPDGDSVTFSLIPGSPASDTIIGKTYTFTPSISDTGKHGIYVIVRDASGLDDTLTMELSVLHGSSFTPDSIPPVITFQSPSKDTVISTDSFEVKITCVDDSSISSVKGYRDVTDFTLKKLVSIPNLWTGMVKEIPAGSYSVIKIVAADSSKAQNKDSITIRIKFDNDTINPVLSLFDPAKDSVRISAGSYYVNLLCKDKSGIASVVCSLGTQSFPVVKNDSVWSANVTGLQSGQFNNVTFVAVDSSLKANKSTLIIKLFYDPTMVDNVPPVIQRISNLPVNMVVKDSVITIMDSLYDESGIDSVYWTLNGKNKRMLIASKVTSVGGIYTLIDTLRRYHLDTIEVFARDKSTNHNCDTQQIIVNFNLPPSGLDTSVITVLNTMKNIVLTAGSPDGDVLTWAKLGDPLHGTVTIFGATAAYTPATDWLGKDSFMVKVADTFWDDTIKVTVTTTDNRISPHNVKIIVQPSSDTVLTGQPLSMSVTMNSDVTPGPTYRWFKNNVAAGTAATLNVASATVTDAGVYKVIIANAAGADSSEVQVTVLPVYTLSVNRAAAGGTVTVIKDTVVYPAGSSVRLTATPAAGYRFVNWTGDTSTSANPLVITMRNDRSVIANYKRQYSLTLTSSDLAKGSVSSAAGNSPFVVDSGVAISISATPTSGYKFKQWSTAASGVLLSSSTATNATVTLTQSNATVQGVFGSVTFKKQLSFAQYPDMILRDGVQVSDGGYMIVGYSGSDQNTLLIKLNAQGDTVWTKIDNNLIKPKTIRKVSAGYLVSGQFSTSPSVNCYGQGGGFLWSYGYPHLESGVANVAIATKDNGYVVGGVIGSLNFLLVKTNSIRSVEWDTVHDVYYTDGVSDCIQTRDNGYVFVGQCNANLSPIAIKTDNSGSFLWTLSNTSIPSNTSTPSFGSVDTTNDGGCVIAGNAGFDGQNNGFMLKVSASGTISSGGAVIFSNTSCCNSIKCLKNGDLLIAGGTNSLGSGGEDIYIARTTVSGTVLNESTYGGTDNEYARSLQLNSDGGAIVVGTKNWVIKTDENGNTD